MIAAGSAFRAACSNALRAAPLPTLRGYRDQKASKGEKAETATACFFSAGGGTVATIATTFGFDVGSTSAEKPTFDGCITGASTGRFKDALGDMVSPHP